MSDMRILSRPVVAADIPAAGVDVEIVASPVQRAALAAAYGLVAVEALSASATLSPEAGGGVTLSGRVVGDIVQTCVVSLAPVEQHIDEPVSVRFVAPSSPEAPKSPKPGAEVMIDPDQLDPPEVLAGPTIDLGALAEEHFVMAIDPYPRAPDATLPAEATGARDDTRDSPFAVLAELARREPPKR